MVRNTGDGAQANMDSNEIESSTGMMTSSSDDVMKLNGDVTMPMHHNATSAVTPCVDATAAGDGSAGWAPTPVNGVKGACRRLTIAVLSNGMTLVRLGLRVDVISYGLGLSID